MKLWAKLDDDNIVVEIIEEVDEGDLDGTLAVGTTLGMPAEKKQGLVRVLSEGPAGTYAAPGFKYDPELKGFVPPQTDPTDFFDRKTFSWLPAKPDDVNDYRWNDETQDWVKIEES